MAAEETIESLWASVTTRLKPGRSVCLTASEGVGEGAGLVTAARRPERDDEMKMKRARLEWRRVVGGEGWCRRDGAAGEEGPGSIIGRQPCIMQSSIYIKS